MKRVALILLLNLIVGLTYAQGDKGLDRFKTGTFTYQTKKREEVEIIRTKSKQTEVFNGGKSKLILKIEWLNDSTYVLTHKKSINAPGCLDKGDWIKVIIIDSDENTYTCRFTSNKCGSGQNVFIKLE